MRHVKFFVGVALLSVVVTGCTETQTSVIEDTIGFEDHGLVRSKLTDAQRDILKNAESFELLALDPGYDTRKSDRHDDEYFRDFLILGSQLLEKKQEQYDVLSALYQGITENDGIAAMCFDPRHGVRAKKGDATVDLVICFECLQIYVYNTAGERTMVTTSESPRAMLTKILNQYGIQVAS